MLNRTQFKHSTRDFVYESLRESIMDLDLPPGTAISEKEISEELEVSRTPVREAFLRLKEDELLTVLPQRGSFVALIDLDHVEEARFLREQAEAGIIRLACENFSDEYLHKLEMNLEKQKTARDNEDENALYTLDKEFHRLIAEGTAKHRVWKTIQRMDTHSMRLRKLSIALKLNWKVLVEQHEAMVEAIKEKEQKKAEELIRSHLALLIYDQKALKEQYPDYFS
ncbi:GntR family transcriptional regulator [Oceanobacillus jeddahense]|uniref:GntR family transcriptional regulator n=1 Tax=Oceanobacillus jeddahense TaxID=1462527 RepID=A0ABY5JRC5_9BACI|nr:GntR family transcriptional regulator [Oceanobacillus jeddahense]UUI02867.1 GntR family transcriptional regulator [Oceanobacillus jeddahense]